MTEPQGLDNWKRIWQSQSREDTKLTLEQVREKARSLQLQRRTVGWALLSIAILMMTFYIRLMVRTLAEHRPGGVILIPIGVCILYICISVIFLVYLGIRHKSRQINQALRMVDGLERDVE